jgi:hypothetical protein
MTIAAYTRAVLLDEKLLPMPASHARLGACILGAISALATDESAQAAEATRLLREAQRLGAEFSLAYLAAFDAAHATDEPWTTPDRPERRNGTG